ncbi:hypothetical protein MKX01_035359 [Papaver californicum]|nr:hypothetical protein MKX01_035359 [Papaver californicum]
MEPEAERKHHFFKIFHEEEQYRRLCIPVAFCPRLPTDSPACKWAILQGPNGASWIVEVNKTENGTFLEDGWEIFVQENGLKKYDFLVFRHDGGMQFRVKVFKGNGCPREECFAPVPSPIPVQEIHGPREDDILLQNEEGCTWDLRVTTYGIQYRFNAGWKKFSTDHNLKIGDYVIFELIDKTSRWKVSNELPYLSNSSIC